MVFNVEYIIFTFFLFATTLGSYFILRINWKKYGLLFFLSGIIGNILCLIFINLKFYTFGVSLFAVVTLVLTIFPFYVVLGVHYSPKSWAWKIPFYWGLVHIGVFIEAILQRYTEFITYNFQWDLWDSYTWWWLYLLVFEWVGGLIIPTHIRKPLSINNLKYGKLFWGILHFILITTIFLGGVYLGYSLSITN